MSNLSVHRSKRYLSAVLKQVECPLSWIEHVSILKKIPDHIFRPFDSLQAFIKNLLDTSTKDILGNNDIDELPNQGETNDEEEVLASDGTVTIKEALFALNIAALWAYTGQVEESQKWLRIAGELAAKISPDLREGCRSAVMYLLEALQWSVKELQRTEKDQGKVAHVEEFAFPRRREELKEKDDGAKAVLRYCKVCLGELLMVPEENVLKNLKRIVKMDPDYYEWHHDVYHLIRKIRMMKEDSSDALMIPCEDEMNFCEKAYSLAPDNFQCLLNVAFFIKDGLRTLDKGLCDENEDEYLLCVNILREALRLATDNKRKREIYKIKIYLAEVSLFGRSSKLLELQDEGRSLMEECEAMYPNLSFVLHTLGKMYHYGTYDTRKFRDQKLAKVYYQRSLKECPHNFACVMDYMKLIKGEAPRLNFTSAQKLYKEILNAFQNCRVSCKVDHQLARLDILEGCILWIFNPGKEEQACRVWMRVLKNWPDFRDSLYSTMQKPPFFLPRNKPTFIHIPHVIALLKDMQNSEDNVRPEESLRKTISLFLNGLGKIHQVYQKPIKPKTKQLNTKNEN